MARKRMVTLWYDDETGELHMVEESPVFRSEDILLRADVWKDALGYAEQMYREAITGLDTEFTAQRVRALAADRESEQP